ncbi:hypothetical protein ANN_00465 [Periplaneta americana]|uniref:Uncharacterized protein n=1 Tax=Periplaneta americana TaxID=6978 RepID=A0ABQ8TUW7_PERAM|nr:hypothetical protein ANN_00465 [Periplaneta americana]
MVDCDKTVNGLTFTRCERVGNYKMMNELTGYFATMLIFGYLASDEGDNAGEMSPGSNTESYPAFAHIGLRENPGKTSTRFNDVGGLNLEHNHQESETSLKSRNGARYVEIAVRKKEKFYR